MARVKRSSVANQTSSTQVGASPESTVDAPGEGRPDIGPPPPPPADPRDAAIRTLQVALAVVSVIALSLAVAVVIFLVRGTTPEQDETSSPSESAVASTEPSADPSSATDPLFLNNYIAVNADAIKPEAIIVEIHADYQCGWCVRAEQIYGQALYELSASGDIDLRVHMRTLIGDQANDASRRATAAALCADQVDAFWAYHSVVFSSSPDSDQGYSDTQLREVFAAQAGITGQALSDFQTCYDEGATVANVQAMEAEGVAAGINSTPTFFVNGIRVNFDLQSTSETVQPITAANLLSALEQVA